MNNDFLNQSVEFIKGVGPSRSKLLNDELNIKTVKDLIDFYPFRYIDRMSFFKINQLPLNNSEVQIIGKIKSIKKLYPNSHFIGHGGELMKKEGLKLIYHTNDLAVMGLTEVVKKLPFLLNVMGETLGKIREVKPDRIILIDYPGFNLRLSRNISGLNIPITYFILPQLWAWKENRKKYFLNYIDQAISIFPFEKEWFEKNKIPMNIWTILFVSLPIFLPFHNSQLYC